MPREGLSQRFVAEELLDVGQNLAQLRAKRINLVIAPTKVNAVLIEEQLIN